MKLFEIFGVVKLDDSAAINSLNNLDSKARQVGGSMTSLASNLSGLGSNLTAAGGSITKLISGPLIAFGAISMKVGTDFQQSMANVQAVSGAAGADFDALTAKAREMGATTKFSASQAADALSYMGMAGWETQQMLDGIPGVMSLAAASGEDLAKTSDILTDAITAFGDKAGDAGRYADVMAAASASANTNVAMLGESFKMVAPVAGAMGYSLEDTSKALSLMANSGIKATQGGSSLRNILVNLAKPTEAMQMSMDRLGISLTDSSGNMKTLDEMMVELRSSFSGLSEEERAFEAATIAGKTGMAGLLAIISSSNEEFDKLGESINGSNGRAQEMADIMNDTFQGRLLKMKSVLEEVGLIVFTNLEPAFDKLVASITKTAIWFGNLSPFMQKIIITGGILLAALGPILIIAGQIAMGISSIITLGTSLSGIFAAIGAAGGVLVSVLTATLGVIFSPVGLIIAGIVAVIAIGVLLFKNWDKIKEMAVKLKDFVLGSFIKLKDGVVNTFTKIKDAMIAPIEKARDTVKAIIEKIKDFFKFKITFPKINVPWSKNKEPSDPNKPGKTKLFAKGGYISKPTEFARSNKSSFIGGEEGGEGIVPLEGKHMQTLIAEAISQLNNSNTPQIINNINVNGAIIREEEDIRKLAKEVSEEIERFSINKNRSKGVLI